MEVGRRIAEARQRAGLTQDAVAEVLDTDKSTISKIEHGRRRLDGFELSLVAERLGTTARELLGMPGRRPGLAVAARLGASEARMEPAVRRAQQILELDALADELELPDASAPKRPVPAPRVRNVDQARQLARSLRDELGLGDGGIGDLVGLCERDCGLDVAVEPLGTAPSGLLVNHDNVVALAMVNADDISARRRFTLAHELGHYLLADAEEFIVEDAEIGTDVNVERRANRFAVELLLPEEGVQRTAGEDPVDERTVVDGMVRYGVSREAFLNRLQELRLLTAPVRAPLEAMPVRALFAAAGRASDYETFGALATRRAPARIEGRLVEAYRSGRIGIGPLAQLIGRDPDDVRDEMLDAGMAPVFEDHDFAFDTI